MALEAAPEAGYKLPVRGERPRYRPPNKLREAFDEWFCMVENRNRNPDDYYNLALDILRRRHIRPLAKDAADLLGAYADRLESRSRGILLSACFSRSPEDVIVYQGITGETIREVGYSLPKGKTLFIPPGTDLVGADVGDFARGIIVACADGVSDVGRNSTGTVISTGNGVQIAANGGSGTVLLRGSIKYTGEVKNSRCLLVSDAQLDVFGAGAYWAGGFEGTAVLFVKPRIVYCDKAARLIDAERRSVLPELRGYFEALLAPFSLGVPLDTQVAAAAALDQEAIREAITGFLEHGGYPSYDQRNSC